MHLWLRREGTQMAQGAHLQPARDTATTRHLLLCRNKPSTHGRHGEDQAGPWRVSAGALPNQTFIFLPSPCFWTNSESRVDLRCERRTLLQGKEGWKNQLPGKLLSPW